ncbi:hypothetical protein SRHO_G00278620 [Serrasalmus rhombeus]
MVISSLMAMLFQNVEKLWQADVIPYRNERRVSRSQQEQEVLDLLQAPKKAVMPHLQSTVKCLSRGPERPAAYKDKIKKLERAGYVLKLLTDPVTQQEEARSVPHQMLQHNALQCFHLFL